MREPPRPVDLNAMPPEFTHLDPLGRARMVDVTAKEPSHRRAVARCRVHMEAETASRIASGAITKGDVLAVARVAGIQAAKQTPHLLPLCHPLLVGAVLVNFRLEDTYVEVEANVDTVDRTGVEMEALTAAAVAALTIYDMCKSVDRSMTIGELSLWEKTGGRSGTWRRPGRGGRSVLALIASSAPCTRAGHRARIGPGWRPSAPTNTSSTSSHVDHSTVHHRIVTHDYRH